MFDYQRVEKKILEAVRIHGKEFESQVDSALGESLPKTIYINLIGYGVWGSYHLPDGITYNINTKEGPMTLFHEMIHLVMEPMIQEYEIEQWEKERIIDLILHSTPFSSLHYTSWQRNYHGTEEYIDPLFHELFFDNRLEFFKRIPEARR